MVFRRTSHLLAFVAILLCSTAFGHSADPEKEFAARAEKLLLDQNYTELDQFANEERKKGEYFPRGISKLGYFYQALAGRETTLQDFSIDDRLKQLEAWMDASHSISSRIAYSSGLITFAWMVRGGGAGSTISPDRYRKIENAVSKIDEILTLAEKDLRKGNLKDAPLYRTWMDAGVLEGYPEAKMKKMLFRALDCDPWFAPPIRVMVQYSLPRWHGKKGDLIKLRNELISKTRATTGEAAYAVVAMCALEHREIANYHSDGFEWERVRKGMEDWVNKFPDAEIHSSRLLRAAHLESDRAAAMIGVNHLKGRYDPEVFELRQDFLRSERWARDDSSPGPDTKVFEAGPVRVVDVAYIEGGKSLLVANNHYRLNVCSATSGERTNSFNAKYGSVRFLRADPAGLHVVFACHGIRDSSIAILDVESGEQVELGKVNGDAQGLDLSSDLKVVIAGDQKGRLRKWKNAAVPVPVDWSTGKAEVIGALAISPNGEKVISSVGGQVTVWDIATREKKVGWDQGYRQIWAAAWNPTGDIVAIAGMSNLVKLLSPAGQPDVDLIGGNTSIQSLAFSPDGKKLVAGTMSASRPHLPGEIVVWDVEKRKVITILTGHRMGIWKVAVSPDGTQIASTSEDGSMRLWPMP